MTLNGMQYKRLNAAGRLEDMSLGIRALLATNEASAKPLVQQLHELNLQRREIETDMQFDAMSMLDEASIGAKTSISVYQPDWHQGVIGILASRIKERFHRPTIVFASADNGLLKGSGRSISGLHLRDALDIITKHHPDLIVKFGGHAMAAGLTIRETDFARFDTAFEVVVQTTLPADALEQTIEIDGTLAETDMHWDTAQLLTNAVWGQGFPPPLFHDTFDVLDQRIVGEKHLKLKLKKELLQFDAIYFNQQQHVNQRIEVVYQLQPNTYNGVESVQLNIHTIL